MRKALKDIAPRGRGGRSNTGPVYTNALAEEICDRLAAGEPLAQICRDAHMPDERAVRKWVQTRAETFGPMYTRAREIGYDSIAEGILQYGASKAECVGPDGYIDNGEIQRLRMLSDNKRWLLAKLRPKQYGDRVVQEITGSDGSQLVTRIELIPVEPRRRQGPDIEADGSPVEARNQRSLKIPQKP